jgi:hypothetical protein
MASGGIAEIFETSDRAEIIVLARRRGFVREALTYGVPIVPVYLFGNTACLSCLSDPCGVLQSVSRALKMSVTLFWGRFGLPIPRRSPITAVMGDPIVVPHVPQPSDAQIDEWHAVFVARERELFEKHKAAYGWGDKQLIVK